jgi:hypothetical protein
VAEEDMTVKRITDLSDYTSVLPYASELFGVYQPLLGWRSRRKLARFDGGVRRDRTEQVLNLRRFYQGIADLHFNADHHPDGGRVAIGKPARAILRDMREGLLIEALADRLRDRANPPTHREWEGYINEEELLKLLNGPVMEAVQRRFAEDWRRAQDRAAELPSIQARATATLKSESATAGLLLGLIKRDMAGALGELFYAPRDGEVALDTALPIVADSFKDPFLTFDPKREIGDVSVSPVGIVHLFRQYFFELDTFLGTPVGHVWLSPGSTVELVEVSTRRVAVEKTFETLLDTVTKTERSETDEDEISEAVKQSNRDDMKLGFSATVTQSWGTGSATATGSLNLDKTQETARDQQHRRSRQQVEKLSTEIRQSYKTTFRTVTETIDTSSKRYVLTNGTPRLIN